MRSLPCVRTIERVLQRNGITLAKVRLAPYLPNHTYPTPQADDSNQLPPVDCVGPIYLKGHRQRYYILVGRDAFDGAVCLRIYRSRKMETILHFPGECWKAPGRPAQAQFDNTREFVGWGPAARYLSWVIRLCLRFGVGPIFIPPARPQYNGGVEHFNGWFSSPPVSGHLHPSQRPQARTASTTGDSQRPTSAASPEWSDTRPISPAPQASKVSARLLIPIAPLPVAARLVTFTRSGQVTPHGIVHLLSQTFKVGKRLRGGYIKMVLDSQRAHLTAYRQGRVFKRWPYPFVKK